MQWDNLKIPLLSAIFAIGSRAKAVKAQDNSVIAESFSTTAAKIVDEEAERQNASFNDWCNQHSGRKLNQEL